MKVICISGKAQHGKDTAAVMLKQKLESAGHRVLITHYGDLLKHICSSFFGWDGKKSSAGRYLLQHIGTDVIRAKRSNFWVDYLSDILHFFPEQWDYVLIADCRFPNEVETMKAEFDTIHIRIVRRFGSPLSEEQQAHPSETALDDYTPDYYVCNTGTLDDLSNALSDLITKITGPYQLTLKDCMPEYNFDDFGW